MKLEAKQRLIDNVHAEMLAAGFTFEDNGAPVENCGGNINTAGVDEDAAATLEDQLAHAKKHEAHASDPEVKSAYGRLVSELTRAVTASEADLGPEADTVEANDTSDFMNLTVADPGQVSARSFTKAEAVAAFAAFKAEEEVKAGRALTADELMAIVRERQEQVAASEDPEMESDVQDPIGDGEEFNLLVDGDPSQEEPEVSELTQNDGGVQPPTDQPLLLDDCTVETR